MILNTRTLGSSTVDKLKAQRTTPILTIGSDTFTRRGLAKVDCFNFMAAKNLSDILNAELKVPNARHVYDAIHPTALALPRLGPISLAVLSAAWEALGIGGDDPLDSYIKKHESKDKDAPSLMVTFHTLKAREQKERSQERKDKKARKAARRDTAHTIRRERFTTRHATQAATKQSTH